MKIILKKILPLLILLIVIFFYFLGFTVIELIKKAQEAEKNLIACRTIALRIVEFLENTPKKWPPSYEDLMRSKIIVLGRLPFEEIRKRAQLNLNIELNEIFNKFPVGTVNSKNFPRFVISKPPRFINVEYECNFWILEALRKANGKKNEEGASFLMFTGETWAETPP